MCLLDRLPKTICRQCPQNPGIVGGESSTLGQAAAAAIGGVTAKLVGFVTGQSDTLVLI